MVAQSHPADCGDPLPRTNERRSSALRLSTPLDHWTFPFDHLTQKTICQGPGRSDSGTACEVATHA